MAAPVVTMQQLLEAGAISATKHTLEPAYEAVYLRRAQRHPHSRLSQSVPFFARALDFVARVFRRAARSCRWHQAPSASPLRRCARIWPAFRQSPLVGWLLPTGRPFQTPSRSSRRLRALSGDTHGFTRRNPSDDPRARQLEMSLRYPRHCGIPDVMFVIEQPGRTRHQEANVRVFQSSRSSTQTCRLTHCVPVPANDDAARAIRLYCDAVATAATKGNSTPRLQGH